MPRSNKKNSKLKPPTKSPTELRTSSSLFEIEQKMMIDRAVASAKRHEINISPGERSSSDGNCAFQAAINNVNNRNCFKEKYPQKKKKKHQKKHLQEKKKIEKHRPKLKTLQKVCLQQEMHKKFCFVNNWCLS